MNCPLYYEDIGDNLVFAITGLKKSSGLKLLISKKIQQHPHHTISLTQTFDNSPPKTAKKIKVIPEKYV